MTPATIHRTLLVLALTCTVGCASTHTGAFAIPVDANGRVAPSSAHRSGLVISSRQVPVLSSRNFGVLEVTFENGSNKWVRITSTALDFGTEARNAAVFIPSGEDLERWQEGTQRRNAIRDANTATGLDLLLFGALVASAAGGRSAVGAAGAVVGVGTAGVMAGRELQSRVEAAEAVSIYPANHLMSVPFSVPPGLAIKRWIVLNAAGSRKIGCISYAQLQYQTEDQLDERVRLSFMDMQSEWQRSACEHSSSP